MGPISCHTCNELYIVGHWQICVFLFKALQIMTRQNLITISSAKIPFNPFS